MDDAVALGEDLGISPFPWQRYILTDWCACSADGKPAYVTCGLDVPRQNGKNAALEIYELYRLAVCVGRVRDGLRPAVCVHCEHVRRDTGAKAAAYA